jgi:hypothetical protein
MIRTTGNLTTNYHRKVPCENAMTAVLFRRNGQKWTFSGNKNDPLCRVHAQSRKVGRVATFAAPGWDLLRLYVAVKRRAAFLGLPDDQLPAEGSAVLYEVAALPAEIVKPAAQRLMVA